MFTCCYLWQGFSFLRMSTPRTFLAVHWLRIHLPMQEVQVRSLVQGAKIPHALGPKNQNIKQKQCSNKFSKDFKNGPHQKNLKKKKKKNENPCHPLTSSNSLLTGQVRCSWLLFLKGQPRPSPHHFLSPSSASFLLLALTTLSGPIKYLLVCFLPPQLEY